jgi:phage terminase large subunit-like protein
MARAVTKATAPTKGRVPGQKSRLKPREYAPTGEPITIRVPHREPLYATYGQSTGDAEYVEAFAEAPIEWIEKNLWQYKGRWKGRPVRLFEWEKQILRHAFGWINPDGTRLTREVYVETPRKAGKSTLAAGVGLYLAHADGEGAPEVYFAAYDKDQARICYDMARYMTELSPDLAAVSDVYVSRHEIVLRENPGGTVRPLSRDMAKQFGLSTHGLIYDELMTQKSREMWDALTTSQGSREQPLRFAITTAGWDQLSICFEQHELTRQIAEGTTEDESFLGVIYGLEMDADWSDEENWLRANPSLGDPADGATVSIDYYRQKHREATNQPTAQNAFRTLFLSQWVGQAERFFEMGAWDACDAVDVDPPANQQAFGGLDLSATQDLTAFAVVNERSGLLEARLWAWLPEEGIRDREKRDRAPYRVWARDGWLTLTPGNTIDYDFVRAGIERAAELYDLQDVQYDRWNASHLVQDLEKDGIVKMVTVGQGFASMSSPMKATQKRLLEGGFAFGGNPLLRWCASNVAAAVDPAGNVKPDKSRSAHRIDPVVALIMAVDGWERRGRKRESIYARRRAAAAA